MHIRASVPVTIAALALSAGLAPQAHAGLVTLQVNSATGVGSGISYGASYQGTLQWSYTGGTAATVTVSLTNTSSVQSNLAAFVVGLADTSMQVTQVLAPANFAQLTGNGLKATPFGDYDWGSASTGTFNGGGNTTGLAKGQSGTWVFSVSGTAAALAAVSGPSVFNGVNAWDFVVHVKGISSGSGGGSVSEKLTSTLSSVTVPAPGAAALAGIAALVARRRRS